MNPLVSSHWSRTIRAGASCIVICALLAIVFSLTANHLAPMAGAAATEHHVDTIQPATLPSDVSAATALTATARITLTTTGFSPAVITTTTETTVAW